MTDPLTGHIEHMATMLCVTDIERSLGFYRDKLGFRVRESMEHIALIQRDAILLYLFLESPPTEDKPDVWLRPPSGPGSGSVILCFRVDDCRVAYEGLVDAGVDFLTPPKSPPWGGWRCFALDPDGNVIEFEEP
jgi:catechol 2,3-dioxygenase-like lactoylglutathione lyase family enzyme